MPALSSTMKEGRVVTWLKAEGDEIEAGEAIMVVESDKADMDVEAFEDGFLAKILTQEGETAEVGAVVALVAALQGDIASVAEGGGGGDDAAAPAAAAIVADASPAAAGGELLFRFSRHAHGDIRNGGWGGGRGRLRIERHPSLAVFRAPEEPHSYARVLERV
jgi:pyruvate dehydrogenase E2 component (dihydrolipoamide acetyltransferase)